MDLLPKAKHEFSTSSYWEEFFKKRGTKAFEWYGEYSTFCTLLAKYIKTNDKILVTGCGNSDMSAQMFDFGYKNITNIDISSNVILQMKQKNLKQRPDLVFLEMDLFNTSFADESFSVVLDKGTLDAIYSVNTVENLEKVDKMFKEINRLLKVGGRYVCISLAQDFIAQKVLRYFSDEGWLSRVCVKQNVDNPDDDHDAKENNKSALNLPVFVFVFTKFKKLPNAKPILEVSYFEGKIERKDSVEDVLSSISDLQNYAFVRRNLSQGSSLDKQQLCVSLYSSESSSAPRYTIHIVDGRGDRNKKFAVFIVPQGRESEWMFSTDEGRIQLQKSCNYERLLVVLLSRFHEYASLDVVKEELSSKVLQLAPPNIQKQSPFLTIGQSISVRSKRFEGKSKLSGTFVVEDVQIDNNSFRRLVFHNRPDVIQSEVALKKVTKKGKKKSINSTKEEYEVDHSQLPNCGYYSHMVAGLFLMPNFKAALDRGMDMDIALVGLGGGGLAMFLYNMLNNTKITAVEIDAEVANVAKLWFGLKVDDGRIKVIVQDGIEFVKNSCEKELKYDALIIDVDNKDNSLAFSSPPVSFIEESFIQSCARSIKQDGIYIVNLATRSSDSRDLVINRLKSSFQQIYSSRVEENINEILYCLPDKNYFKDEDDVSNVKKYMQNNLDELKSKMNLINRSYFDSFNKLHFLNIVKIL